ncbi:early nodulin-93-like [Hordeum vulgare subsp. vulgare]|nr:early nodulin-93-like [Hordeum vulgare subsp. vulgare]
MSSTATVTGANPENKLALAKRCSREATLAGAKAAALATVASAAATLASVRMLPWAKANLNPTGQALIICTVAGMAYFVAADKTILSLARRHSYESAPDHLKDTSFHGAAPRPRPPPPAFFSP